ncbi:hypothetical protein MBLNU13_g06536t1 [Cladosporium sp. NU13]
MPSGSNKTTIPMSGIAASRIQSANSGPGRDSGFASRAQSAAATNANAGLVSQTGSASGPKGSNGGHNNGKK